MDIGDDQGVVNVLSGFDEQLFGEDIPFLECKLPFEDVWFGAGDSLNPHIFDDCLPVLLNMEPIRDRLVFLIPNLVAADQVEDVSVVPIQIGERRDLSLNPGEIQNRAGFYRDEVLKLFIAEHLISADLDSSEEPLTAFGNRVDQPETGIFIIVGRDVFNIGGAHFDIDIPAVLIVLDDRFFVCLFQKRVVVSGIEERHAFTLQLLGKTCRRNGVHPFESDFTDSGLTALFDLKEDRYGVGRLVFGVGPFDLCVDISFFPVELLDEVSRKSEGVLIEETAGLYKGSPENILCFKPAVAFNENLVDVRKLFKVHDDAQLVSALPGPLGISQKVIEILQRIEF